MGNFSGGELGVHDISMTNLFKGFQEYMVYKKQFKLWTDAKTLKEIYGDTVNVKLKDGVLVWPKPKRDDKDGVLHAGDVDDDAKPLFDDEDSANDTESANDTDTD